MLLVKVFLAELIGHDQYFAIKCLKKNVVIEDNDVESTMIERKVLALGSANSFICKLFCTFQTAVSCNFDCLPGLCTLNKPFQHNHSFLIVCSELLVFRNGVCGRR